MKTKKKDNKIFKIFSIVFFVVAVIDALIGLYSFISTISAYTSQGYALGEVLKYLIPSQVVPTVIEPLFIFAGIGLILLGINNLLSEKTEEEEVLIADEGSIVYESIKDEEVEDIQKSENDEDVLETEDSNDIVENVVESESDEEKESNENN
ncbi:hypothetical protein [Anaerofustis sp.]|uniref:hypothetical protein n=1 Tax=Anaerofustis sp. TaxID=1872517 RepID=UPI0025BAE0FD|nr:hypothetical protein [Anaerofustis sp.]